jgi:hypothetical protein
VVGVDPGLVHTGVVSLLFKPDAKEILVSDRVVLGPNAADVKAAVPLCGPAPHIFIEGYRPRSHYDSDQRMVSAVSEIRAATKGTVLQNTGVKKVVKQPLMELLGCWKFSTVTHHQDLRSAARIALLGMLKDDLLNSLLTDVVRSHLAGRTWACT